MAEQGIGELIEIEADWPGTPADPTAQRLVLVAAVGESPAVVSETVWALFNEGGADLARIVLFTTETGRQLIRGEYDNEAKLPRQYRKQPLAHLPTRHKAWEHDDLVLALCRLCREWQRPVPAIEIHVPRNDREEIKDIRNDADDRAFGNVVFREIRTLTDDGKPALHVSIAGGRKTMGTRLAAVLSMFGRPQDELSHVLVTRREFEGKGYWCPSHDPAETRVEQRDGSLRRVNIDDPSAVQLVRQRFWPLRNLIDEPVLRGERAVTVEELELAVEAMLDPPPVSFSDASHSFNIGYSAEHGPPRFHVKVTLEATQYALYRTLAAAKGGELAAADPQVKTGYLQALDFRPEGFGAHTTLADGSLRPFAPAGTYFLSLAANRARATLARHADVKAAAELEANIRTKYLGPMIKHINDAIHTQIGYSRIAEHFTIAIVPVDKEEAVAWSIGLE